MLDIHKQDPNQIHVNDNTFQKIEITDGSSTLTLDPNCVPY